MQSLSEQPIRIVPAPLPGFESDRFFGFLRVLVLTEFKHGASQNFVGLSFSHGAIVYVWVLWCLGIRCMPWDL